MGVCENRVQPLAEQETFAEFNCLCPDAATEHTHSDTSAVERTCFRSTTARALKHSCCFCEGRDAGKYCQAVVPTTMHTCNSPLLILGSRVHHSASPPIRGFKQCFNASDDLAMTPRGSILHGPPGQSLPQG